MSRLEIIMYAVLAVSLLTLVVMLAGRALRNSSRRVRTWREQRVKPDELATLRAERDRLRAERAMLSQSMNMRLDKLRERFVRQEADVVRARNRAGHLAEKLDAAAQLISRRESEIATLKELSASLESDLEKRTGALRETRDSLRTEKETVQRLQGRIRTLETRLAEKDRQLAALREEISLSMAADAALAGGGGMTASVPQEAGQDARERLSRKIAELNAMARQLEEQREKMRSGSPSASDAPGDSSGKDGAGKTKSGGKASRAAKRARVRQTTARVSRKSAQAEKPSGRKLKTTAVERRVRAMEKSAENLGKELEKLDSLWEEKLQTLKTVDKAIASSGRPKGGKRRKSGKNAGSARKGKPKKTASLASARHARTKKPRESVRADRNVISLAERIRALKEQTS